MKNKKSWISSEDVDDVPIRGIRTLFDLYQRCNIAILEPGGFMEAAKDEKWRYVMQEVLKMIRKEQHMRAGWQTIAQQGYWSQVGLYNQAQSWWFHKQEQG